MSIDFVIEEKDIVKDIDNTSMYDVPIISMDIFKTKNDRKENDNGN